MGIKMKIQKLNANRGIKKKKRSRQALEESREWEMSCCLDLLGLDERRLVMALWEAATLDTEDDEDAAAAADEEEAAMATEEEAAVEEEVAAWEEGDTEERALPP